MGRGGGKLCVADLLGEARNIGYGKLCSGIIVRERTLCVYDVLLGEGLKGREWGALCICDNVGLGVC